LKEKQRSEIDNKYKWDLSLVYKSEIEYEEDLVKLEEFISIFLSYENKMLDDAQLFYDAINTYYILSRLFEKIFVYTELNLKVDIIDTNFKKKSAKLAIIWQNLEEKSVWFNNNIIEISEDKLNDFYVDCEKLSEYRRVIDFIRRYKPYTLSKDREELISSLTSISGDFEEAYDILGEAEMHFEKIVINGEEIEVNNTSYSKLIYDGNPLVRKSAFKAFYKAFANVVNTNTRLYLSHLSLGNKVRKIRGFNSGLDMEVFSDEVDDGPIKSVIECVNNNLDSFQNYFKYKAQLLGVQKLHLYDTYVKVVSSEKEYSIDEAIEYIIKALSVLGDDYIEVLKRAFNERWIDYLPNKNKVSGAFSWGSYDTVPYLLLNYNNKLNDISTMAHEIGHSMHSYYSNSNQPYHQSHYKIFVAEVASQVNELLVDQYLIDNGDAETKKYIINELLDKFKSTMHRQTMFAEFEVLIHDLVEKDTPLTSKELNDLYYDLNKKYFGDSVIVDEEIKYEWSRISHFFRDFYVYKYATSFAAAIVIAKRINAGEVDAIKNYREFLTLGSTMDPLSELSIAGVNLSDSKVLEEAIEYFDELFEEFKKINEQGGK